jgi:predicted HTH domain antitoxin
MSLTIPADVVSATELTEEQLAIELAVELYQREKLSLGHAARLAGMKKWAFNDLLAAREIPMHYDEADLRRDLATLQSLANRR